MGWSKKQEDEGDDDKKQQQGFQITEIEIERERQELEMFIGGRLNFEEAEKADP